MALALGVVADDITGGLETAAMLVAAGVDCAFLTDPAEIPRLGDAQAAVVAQKTRVIDARKAAETMRAAAALLLEAHARQIFFKYCATFDSTDKGNIGPVSDALMDLTGAPYTAFCPSSPELRRTVYNGHLFVGRDLVSNSPKRFDPLTPMTDPDLVAVLQRQTKRKVGSIGRHDLAAGREHSEHVIREMNGQGVQYFIADSVENADLQAIAELTADWKLMTGNATIVQFYPSVWRARGYISQAMARRELPAIQGAGVVLAGSCAERTIEQLDHFERSFPVLRLDLANADSAEQLVEQAFSWAAPLLDHGPVAISSSARPEAVQAAQARHGREGAAAMAEAVMGTLAVRLLGCGVRRFVVAGGETSGSVVERTGIKRLTVGAYGGPGIGNATADHPMAVGFCLKSGKLGPVDLFLTALETMKTPRSENPR